ncbi:MAG: methylated-DNA--[protein]-cysteine S-methyltransferase [Pseudomonadota bacterium]
MATGEDGSADSVAADAGAPDGSADKPTYYTFMPSPIGQLLLAGNKAALSLVGFSSGHKARGADPNWERWDWPFARARQQLTEYFDGTRKVFELDLAPAATPFQSRVLAELVEIPYGETTTYLDIAKTLGNPKASRAVGLANGNNPIPLIIPCHRVIGSNGSLTGFGGGLPAKQYLLDFERANSGLFANPARSPASPREAEPESDPSAQEISA